ncbi:membrane protein insertase YidC, partial [Alphaproteobacteria bacterium]|nr:membrane protein insertase YidC [Alphaproteobacteria bacterium]
QHKVNPVSGCLPMVLQIPVLFAIYKVLLISIEMRHAPLFGWIHDMSSPDPTTIFNLFGLIPWMPPSILMIGALPIMMGFTMFLQQKLSPQPMDEMQSKMFLIMPFIFTYMLAQFPAGVVFYWTLTNILAIAQQWALSRNKAPVK